jgi:DNA-binding XRE family transcriptional regulator
MPTGKPNKTKPKGLTLREQLEHEMKEIEARLHLENLRERQIEQLKSYITDRAPLLTRKHIAKVIRELPPDHVRLNGEAATAMMSNARLGTGGAKLPKGALGAAIRNARMAKGWTGAVLGKKIGVHGGSVSNWEAGGMVQNPKVRAKLKTVLGIDVEKIMAPHKGAA